MALDRDEMMEVITPDGRFIKCHRRHLCFYAHSGTHDYETGVVSHPDRTNSVEMVCKRCGHVEGFIE